MIELQQYVVPLIVRIEEYLNNSVQPLSSLSTRSAKKRYSAGSVMHNISDEQKNSIDEYLNGVSKTQTQPDYVCEKMLLKGFVYEDGQLNFVSFYTRARINPDVWHTFISQKHKASEDTMFKIILALQLNEKEAVEFLNLGGFSFNRSNDTHRYILACINTNIYDPDEVYEVLNFYKVHNIYAIKKPRNDCK